MVNAIGWTLVALDIMFGLTTGSVWSWIAGVGLAATMVATSD